MDSPPSATSWRKLLLAFGLGAACASAALWPWPQLPTKPAAPAAAAKIAPSARAQSPAAARAEKSPLATAPLPSPAVLEDALRLLDQRAPGPAGMRARQGIVEQWAQQDPLAALAYVDTLRGPAHASLRMAALENWAERDPAAAAQHFLQDVEIGLQLPEDDAAAANALGAGWARKDASAAWTWASELPAELAAAGIAAIAADPAAISDANLSVLAAQLEPSPAREAAMEALAARAATTDASAAAAAWSAQFSPEDQPAALRGLIGRWMQTDAAAASAWLDTLPASPAKDQGIAALLDSPLAQAEPASAARWRAQIADGELRESVRVVLE